MRSNQDKVLKSVITLLRELADSGTLELGQRETITKEINNLRRAVRAHDPIKIRVAVGRVATIFLRLNGR